MEVAGPLGTLLGLAQRKRASPRGEAYFCIPVPYNEKDIFWGVLVLKGLVGLHRTVQLQLLQRYSLSLVGYNP